MITGDNLEMIYLDTNILVYWLENRPQANQIAQKLTDADQPITTSTLAITEFLAGVDSPNVKQALYSVSSLTFIDVDKDVAEKAASLQKQCGLKIGDAIHLASAINKRCSAFFTNDLKLAQVAEDYLEVLSIR